MSKEPLTFYKLIILYMLSKVETPIPPGIIADYITGQKYTNYFTFQNAVGELLQGDLIQEDSTYHMSYYQITDAGHETLELFGSPLSSEIRQEIDDYLKSKRYDIVNEASFISDYHRTEDGTYLATCTLREGTHVLFHLELDVMSEEDAVSICENWRENSEEIYQVAMRQLLKKES